MSIQIKNYVVVLIIAGLLAAFFGAGWYLGYKKKNNAQESIISTQWGLLKKYTYDIDSLRKYVAEKESVIMTLKQALAQGLIDKEEMKKLNIRHVNQITALKLRVDTLLQIIHDGQVVVVPDTVFITDDGGYSAIILPFSFKKEDTWLNLNGNFNEKGDLSVALKMNADYDIWTGYDRKDKMYKAVITTANPYMNVVGVKSLRIDQVQPKRFGVGLQLGYGLGLRKYDLQPYIGAGLSWNIVRF